MTVDPIAFHDFEQHGWQRAAEYYPDSFGMLTRQTTEPLLDAAGIGPGMRVLDVATGPGYVAGAAAVALRSPRGTRPIAPSDSGSSFARWKRMERPMWGSPTVRRSSASATPASAVARWPRPGSWTFRS